MTPALRFAHARKKPRRQIDQSFAIEADLGRDLVRGFVGEGPVEPHPGVVDQHVDMLPGLVELGGQVRRRTDGSQVRGNDVDPQRRVPLEQPAAQSIEPVSPARHQQQIDAMSGLLPGELRANSAARAGHQRRTVLPIRGHLPVSVDR